MHFRAFQSLRIWLFFLSSGLQVQNLNALVWLSSEKESIKKYWKIASKNAFVWKVYLILIQTIIPASFYPCSCSQFLLCHNFGVAVLWPRGNYITRYELIKSYIASQVSRPMTWSEVGSQLVPDETLDGSWPNNSFTRLFHHKSKTETLNLFWAFLWLEFCQFAKVKFRKIC